MKKIITTLTCLLMLFISCSNDDYTKGVRCDPIDPDYKIKTFLDNSSGYQALITSCQKVISSSQYMVGTLVSETTSYPNYEGYPVKLYEYYTSADVQTGVKKKGRVYLLNPTAQKLATWIAMAVWKAKGKVDTEMMSKVLTNIQVQSGAQFPVCGIVYEDMEGTGQYPYLFKDGVTVYPANRDSWATADSKHTSNYSCSDAQLAYCISITNDLLKTYTGKFARICSTTREDYVSYGGTAAVGTSDSQETRSLKWLDVVRDLYKKAWNSDENELITAWVKDNIQ